MGARIGSCGVVGSRWRKRSGTLVHLALFCFFENWGLYGPRACRWAAVVAHALSTGLVTAAAQRIVMQHISLPSPNEGIRPVWLCMAVGTWTTTSWASLTWWREAVATTRFAGIEGTAAVAAVPALALAGAQLVNFWMARRAQQPTLLSACVVLGGLSMAGSCSVSQGSERALPTWISALYVTFCGVSSWVLLQEL